MAAPGHKELTLLINSPQLTWNVAASKLDTATYSRLFCNVYTSEGTDILRQSNGCIIVFSYKCRPKFDTLPSCNRTKWYGKAKYIAGIILGMGSVNERQRYNVTSSLIGRDFCRHMASLGHKELTHWPLGDVAVILKCNFQTHFVN